MRLTAIALQAIQDHSPRIKTRLAIALGCKLKVIDRFLEENSDNLTKAAAMKVIREDTRLSDAEILEG